MSRYETVVKPQLAKLQKMAEEGCSEREMAKELPVGWQTLQRYKARHPELRAVLEGESDNNAIVEDAFYRRAIGYSYQEISEDWTYEKDEDGAFQPRLKARKVMTREIPPDIGAAKFWLLNRAKERWREKCDEDAEMSPLSACSEETLLEERRALIEELKRWDEEADTAKSGGRSEGK